MNKFKFHKPGLKRLNFFLFGAKKRQKRQFIWNSKHCLQELIIILITKIVKRTYADDEQYFQAEGLHVFYVPLGINNGTRANTARNRPIQSGSIQSGSVVCCPIQSGSIQHKTKGNGPTILQRKFDFTSGTRMHKLVRTRFMSAEPGRSERLMKTCI